MVDIRIINRSGAVVGYYNEDEFEELRGILYSTDRVEVYRDGDWVETLAGDEFEEAYVR